MQTLRLLSLLPSATEIIYSLQLGEHLVGRSHECDFPSSVSALPVCSHPSLSIAGSSAEIDRLVKSRLAAAASIYDLDSELIRRLQPTHLFTQTQCKVCAVNLDDVERALRSEYSVEAEIISLEPHVLSDLWRDIRNVAAAVDCVSRAEPVIEHLQTRMEAIRLRAQNADSRPTVAAIEWIEPLMSAGNWAPEMIEMAGGKNLFGSAGQHSPWMTWKDLVASDPEVIIAFPCGFNLSRTRAEMHWLTGRPEWNELKAVRSRQVYLCDGNQFLNRPGPRLVESLQILAEIIQPAIFAPKLERVGWQRL